MTIKFLYEAPFGIEIVKKIIPHRYPFLFVDGISELNEDRVRGFKYLTSNESYFEGHFPAVPVFPGVLQIETMAQVGACWVLALEQNKGKNAYLMTVETAKFRRPVGPGNRIDIDGNITSLKGRFGRLEAKAYVGDTLISEASLTFAFQKDGTSANGTENNHPEKAND